MKRINWYRFTIASMFTIEVGAFFGWDHIADRTPSEVIASGIVFLLYSISVEK